MKSIYLSITLLLSTLFMPLMAQDKYATKTGHVWLYSKAGELIEGHNKTVASFIDIKTGDIAFRMLVKSFKFESALLEEHFNENYLESGKFPNAEFKGKITNLTTINFSKDGVYKAIVEGNVTIHGVAKHQVTEGTIEVKGQQLIAKAKFQVVPKDYGIDIPSIVRDKIADSIDINIDMMYDLLPAQK